MIPINDELASILAAHLARHQKQFEELKADRYLFPWASLCRPIQRATRRTLHGDGINCGRLQACRAGCTTSGIRSPRDWQRTVFLSPQCSLSWAT